MDPNISIAKLIINSYIKTTSNKVALTFGQILLSRLPSKLNSTDVTVECHPDIFKSKPAWSKRLSIPLTIRLFASKYMRL